MNLIFQDPKTRQRMHEGPLGQYVDSYAAEMCEQGYCKAAAKSQIRLVADFSRWMAKKQITPQQITTNRFKIYLRFRVQHRRPKLVESCRIIQNSVRKGKVGIEQFSPI